jgi:hypothetical protein
MGIETSDSVAATESQALCQHCWLATAKPARDPPIGEFEEPPSRDRQAGNIPAQSPGRTISDRPLNEEDVVDRVAEPGADSARATDSGNIVRLGRTSWVFSNVRLAAFG